MIKGKAKMEFGTGDIRMTGALSGGIGALCCITQEPHEIGEKAPVEDAWDTEQAEVILTFTKTESVQRIEGDNLQEKRSRKEQRRDRQQHYEELESRHDAKALERFRRPAYQSVSVAEYLARKYDITAEVDTIADRRKRNDGK